MLTLHTSALFYLLQREDVTFIVYNDENKSTFIEAHKINKIPKFLGCKAK